MDDIQKARELLAAESAKGPEEISLLADDVPALVPESAALRAIEKALQSRSSRIDQLEEGLRPFAKLADEPELNGITSISDSAIVRFVVKVGDLRRAKALLNGERDG